MAADAVRFSCRGGVARRDDSLPARAHRASRGSVRARLDLRPVGRARRTSERSAAAILVAVAGGETIWRRLQEPNPYAVRAELFRSSIEMARDRPLLGFGLGTWSEAYPAFARFDNGLFVNQAHNDWAQWAAEGGVPFFLIMARVASLLLAPAARSLWGLGLIAVFLHAFVDYPMQQRPALAVFFFALAGVLAGDAAIASPAKNFPGVSSRDSARSGSSPPVN